MRVFGAQDEHTAADRAAWEPAIVDATPAWPPRTFAYSPSLGSRLRAFAPDLLHAHGIWHYPGLAGLRLQQRARRPCLVSPHGMLDAGALAFSRTRKRVLGALVQNDLLHRTTVLHALNVAEARAMRAYGLRNPIAIVPNGVDLPPSIAAAISTPTRSQTRTLLFLGRIHPKKGLAALLDAWIAFASSTSGKNWRLVIGGWDDGGHEKVLREQAAASAAASATIEFVGALWGERKQAALSSTDAFILPSRSEGLPMAVLEAWAHGKPALITRACNLPDGPAAGAALEIAPTVESIRDGLERFAALSAAQVTQMGECARRLVERNYAWPKLAQDMTRLYEAMAADQNIPADLRFNES